MIRFRDVTKCFGETVAVERLNVTIGAAEVVALLGPNGSGKTTTLKMTAGLIRPDAGEVTVGEPPRPAWEPGARRALSFLPQRVAFPETLTGREIVDFYRRLRGVPAERAVSVLRFASLNGAGERAVATYSGGMVQRLGLAVAMLPDAPLLLLDEPTAALDPEGLQAFYTLVGERRASGRTILFTSHQVGDVERLADRVLVMVKGRVAREYTREALRSWRDANGTMTVRLANGETMSFSGPAAGRPAVLDSIRSHGGVIAGFTAEDGRLEALYRDLVAESSARDAHV